MSELIERINAGYINNPLLGKMQMFRYNGKGMRWYYQINDGKPVFYPSITTITGHAMPETDQQKYLRGNMGNDNFFTMLRQKGLFGTFIHEQLQLYFIRKYIDFDKLKYDIQDFALSNNIEFDYFNWYYDAPYVLSCFARFIDEYELECYGTEIPVTYEHSGVRWASLVDFIGTATIDTMGFDGYFYKSGPRKGEPKDTKVRKKVNVLIDWKSGSGFYPQHAAQLAMCDFAVLQTYGFKADILLNVAPTEQRANNDPNYKVMDQTSNREYEYIHYYAQRFAEDNPTPPAVKKHTGKYVQGNWKELYSQVSAEDHVMTLMKVMNFLNKETK